MLQLWTIGALLAGALVFGLFLTPENFARILQPLIVALSIMSAGLLVRLNRGMPNLDWKSLDTNDRKILTQKIVELTREYMLVLALHALALLSLLFLAVRNSATPEGYAQRGAMAFAGGLLALCGARMAYIIWRDYDIVRLQKKLIDDSADKEAIEKATQDALAKVSSIQASGLRAGPKPEASEWNEKSG
jgi:hypothetical protein